MLIEDCVYKSEVFSSIYNIIPLEEGKVYNWICDRDIYNNRLNEVPEVIKNYKKVKSEFTSKSYI